MAFVEPDKSKIYVVISGDGIEGNVSSARIVFTAPLMEPQPVRTNESAKVMIKKDNLGVFRELSMPIIMHPSGDKYPKLMDK